MACSRCRVGRRIPQADRAGVVPRGTSGRGVRRGTGNVHGLGLLEGMGQTLGSRGQWAHY